MIVENLKDQDIVAYLFNEDIVKYGVVKMPPQRRGKKAESENTEAITVQCLTRDKDGFWMYKDPMVEFVVDRSNVILNMTDQCSVMGKSANNPKKIRIIVPVRFITDLKIMKEELKILRRRSGAIAQSQHSTVAPLEQQRSHVVQFMPEANQLEDVVGARQLETIMEEPQAEQTHNQMMVEEIGEKNLRTRSKRRPSPAKKVADSDPEIPSVDEETKAQIEEKVTNLAKRPPKKTKKQIALEAKEEAQKQQETRERKLRAINAVRFARNTSTNFRFDPFRLGMGMISKKDKPEEIGIERKFTNELEFNHQINGNSITLIDMINCFIEEIKESSGTKPVKFRLLSSVPSKTDLDHVLKELSHLSDWLSCSFHLFDEDKRLAEHGLNLWQICFRFLNSLDTSTVYKIREELIAEKTSAKKGDEDCKMDKLCHDLRQIVFMLNSLVIYMDDLTLKNFYTEKASLLKSILMIEAKSSKMYKMFLQYYMQLVDALNVNDDCREQLTEITQFMLMNVTFATDFKSMIEMEQLDPLVFKFMAILSKSQLKISSKYWTMLVTSAGKVIEQIYPQAVEGLLNEPDRIYKWIEKICTQSGVTLEKAFLLAGIRLALTTDLVDKVVQGKLPKKLTQLLKDLANYEDYLPYFVCFYQALSNKITTLDEIRARKIAPINNFISRFLSRTENDVLQDLKIKVLFFKELEQNWNNLRDMLQSKDEAAATIEEVIRMVTKPNEKIEVEAYKGKRTNQNGGFFGGGRANNQEGDIYETVPYPLETYMFWVNLINEIYLSHILTTVPESIANMKRAYASQKNLIEKKLSKEDKHFFLALISNFEDLPIMSLRPDMEASEVRIRVIIAHFMAQFMLMRNQNDFLSLSTYGQKELYQRDQLCAYPGEEEEKFRVIAQMIYDKEYNRWSSTAYDITSLNQCPCGYYYFIGNCGKPYQEYTCPACNNAIGGMNHQYTTKKPQMVSNKDFLKMYGKLEKKSAKVYTAKDLKTIDYSVSMRLIVGASNFKLIEMMTHSRYLLELIVGSDIQKKGLIKMMNMNRVDIPEYLMDYTKACFQPAVEELKSEVKAFNWMNCLARCIHINAEQLNFTVAKRNMYEQALSKKITHFLTNKEAILKSVYKKAEKEDNERAKRLVYNWVNSSVSIEEFKICFPGIDQRVITAMKSSNLIDTKNIDLLGELNKVIAVRYTDPAVIPLVKFALHHEELLKNFRQIMSSILDLSNYIAEKLDCSITWKEACALSISDLTKPTGLMMKNEDIEEVIEKFGNDQTLKTHYDNFCKQWPILMQLKDKYPQQLSFRFMCHGNILSDQTIAELVDPTKAKVAFFLVTEANVESLIINSLLQTLSAFQTNLLSSHLTLFQAINGNKPLKMACQAANPADLVELSDIKDLIASCAKFAKDSDQVDFNVELLERLIADEVFIGKPLLSFTDSAIQHFHVKFDFGQTFLTINSLVSHIAQTQIPAENSATVSNLVKLNPGMVFSALQRIVLTMKRRSTPPTDLEHLSFKDELATLSDLTTCHLKPLFELLEQALFKKTYRSVDVLFQTEISAELSVKLQQSLLPLPSLQLLSQALKRFILRQLLTSNSEKLAVMELATALEFADVWNEQDMPEDIAQPLSGVTVAQSISLVNLIFN